METRTCRKKRKRKNNFAETSSWKYEYRGKITGAVTFDYFPFLFSDKTQMTEGILRQVCQNARQWELIRELSYLGIESEVLWRPFETMSNGEQTKALAALF